MLCRLERLRHLTGLGPLHCLGAGLATIALAILDVYAELVIEILIVVAILVVKGVKLTMA